MKLRALLDNNYWVIMAALVGVLLSMLIIYEGNFGYDVVFIIMFIMMVLGSVCDYVWKKI